MVFDKGKLTIWPRERTKFAKSEEIIIEWGYNNGNEIEL